MITNKMVEYLKELLTGKAKRKHDPRKYSAYHIRIRKMIDTGLIRLQWLADEYPDLLRDFKYELNDEKIPLKRRAKALLKIVATFETEATMIKLMNEMFPDHSIEIIRKEKEEF